MLAKRIIPCLDVKDNVVVKGVQFRNHEIVGDIVELAKRYSDEGADELVFYDITASGEARNVAYEWVEKVARVINIPFCVAGGIRSIETARIILEKGADKISINSPALENPDLINQLVETFGTQCIVIGIDSHFENNDYHVYQYTGSEKTIKNTKKLTKDWVKEVQDRGAGEIVLNCMNQDGMRQGYDIKQLAALRLHIHIPLIASGGAGSMEHFLNVFNQAHVDGALAASVFHKQIIEINELKNYLSKHNIIIRK
ncbi:MAG: imidazole glycerol phosphate synthase subunit HisF [Legionellales bacterium]|jgi:cyclase